MKIKKDSLTHDVFALNAVLKKDGRGVMSAAWALAKRWVLMGFGYAKKLLSAALKQAWFDAPYVVFLT